MSLGTFHTQLLPIRQPVSTVIIKTVRKRESALCINTFFLHLCSHNVPPLLLILLDGCGSQQVFGLPHLFPYICLL